MVGLTQAPGQRYSKFVAIRPRAFTFELALVEGQMAGHGPRPSRRRSYTLR
jgi:hypothetical protein